MHVAIVDTKKKTFLANNHRWYSLKRSVRKAPAPKVFNTKSHAVKYIISDEQVPTENFSFVKPEDVIPSVPRGASVRHITCVGRAKR